MSGIELHADYDRDGRLTRNPAERDARLRWPGAVVVPNMDRDQRRLPSSVGNATMPQADYELTTARSGDDELVPLEVRVSQGALAPGESLVIHCSGVMHTRVRLSDSGGAIVPHRPGAPELYVLPTVPANGILRLTLQVRTIAGASFGRVSGLDLGYRHDPREETRFELTLMRVDSGGDLHAEDHGRFSVSPFILSDRLAPAYRLYMVNNGLNWPSFSDVWEAARRIRVPVIDVDWRYTDNDTWLQDQYQVSLMQGVNGFRELILHLPRLRHDNTINTITDNLEEFVNSHFRSKDIGLYRDLWDRVVPVRTANGTAARPTFRELDDWTKKAWQITDAVSEMNRIGGFADSSWQLFNPDDWVEALFGLETTLQRLHRALEDAKSGASREREAQLDGFIASSQAIVDTALQEFSVDRSGGTPTVVSDLGGASVALSPDMALRLFDRAEQMHSSANYGGNIESTPPAPGAPLGKILIGNAINPDNGGEFVDPDLLRVLAKQRKQPIVEIDTTWLRVGHVDEMIAVVPHSGTGFSFLHASSAAAIELLERAEAKHLAGLPSGHPMVVMERRPPSGVLPRLMTDGTNPVTRLFRGKAWAHIHRRSRRGQVIHRHEPPDIYRRLCGAFGSSTASTGLNVHDIGYIPGIGPDRRYPADITPSELLWSELDLSGNSSNRSYDSGVLVPSRNVLDREFPGIAVLPVPVLFDRVDSTTFFASYYWRDPTTAYSPDVANCQVLNGHILVPKPYGPRMRPADAIDVVRESMAAVGVPGSVRARVGRRLIGARRMTRARYWVEKVAPAYLMSSIGTIIASYGGLQTMDDVKDMFKDSFPGANDAELERRIIQPNRRRFDSHGYLRDDHSVIRFDDGMVDLFELFIAAVAAEIGVRLHFVDSWYYHLGEGQIHCATNVLRKPRQRGIAVPDVWDAPDHGFRTTIFDFAEESISVSNS